MVAYTLIVPGLGSTRNAIESIRELLRIRCTGIIEVFDYDSRGAWNMSNFLRNQWSSWRTDRLSRLLTKLVQITSLPSNLQIHLIVHSHGALLLYKALIALSVTAQKRLSLYNIIVDAFGPAKLIPTDCKYFALQGATNYFHERDWILRMHGKVRAGASQSDDFDHKAHDGTVFRIRMLRDPGYVSSKDAHKSYFDANIWDAVGSCTI